MNQHGLILLEWRGKRRAFRLGLDEIELLESKFDLSLFELTDRLRARKARTLMVLSVVCVGLIGAGELPAAAQLAAEAGLDEQSLEDCRDVALAICLAAMARIQPDDQEFDQGKPDAATSA